MVLVGRASSWCLDVAVLVVVSYPTFRRHLVYIQIDVWFAGLYRAGAYQHDRILVYRLGGR